MLFSQSYLRGPGFVYMLFCESVLLWLFAVLLWAPAVPHRCRTLRVVLPASKAFALGCFAVWPVSHFGEGVWPAVCDGHPAVFGPQGFCLRGLTGGGSLEPYWDALGWTGHQGDGLSLQVRAWWRRHGRERKHLIVICAITGQENVSKGNISAIFYYQKKYKCCVSFLLNIFKTR